MLWHVISSQCFHVVNDTFVCKDQASPSYTKLHKCRWLLETFQDTCIINWNLGMSWQLRKWSMKWWCATKASIIIFNTTCQTSRWNGISRYVFFDVFLEPIKVLKFSVLCMSIFMVSEHVSCISIFWMWWRCGVHAMWKENMFTITLMCLQKLMDKTLSWKVLRKARLSKVKR